MIKKCSCCGKYYEDYGWKLLCDDCAASAYPVDEEDEEDEEDED